MALFFSLIRNKVKKKSVMIFLETFLNIPYSVYFFFVARKVRAKMNKKRYYASVCGIFKNEAPYLREWIEYNRLVGVDHIYLYNNNSTDNFREIINQYIQEGYVSLIEWTKSYAQIEAYEHCYHNFKDETNWLAFFDIDEFICPKIDINIKSFLSKYEGYPGLLIYWQMFGTNGLIKRDFSKLVIEQYTNAWPNLDGTGKVFFSTEDSYVPTNIYHHWMGFKYGKIKVPVMNEHKKFLFFPQIYKAPRKNTIQLNHYWSKSLEEYVYKIKKGDVITKSNEDVRKKFSFFIAHENNNTTENKVIFRFLIQLKMKLNSISI